jgi:prevent-host-death family protein
VTTQCAAFHGASANPASLYPPFPAHSDGFITLAVTKKMYRNYNEVLRDIAIGEPVFLTKNGRGKFAIIDISEYEKMKTSLKLLSQLAKGERPEKRKDG